MTTPQEKRKIRIKNDYQEMLNIKGKIVSWQAIDGEAPYIEAYNLAVNIRTIISPKPEYRDSHIIIVKLLPNYPQAAPLIVMQSSPQPYHPNWFTDGRFCSGTWDFYESLGQHIVRMLRTLQFDPEITNPRSAANQGANAWYLANLKRNREWFPCDQQTLPDPTGKKAFEIQIPKPSKKAFRIG
jgi:ubiquitin-protein ligase